MERNKKISLLFLFLALPNVCSNENCPNDPDNNPKDLTCESDYDRTITCVWNSTRVSDHQDNVCTILGVFKGSYVKYSTSCVLTPVDASRPTLKKCSMIFNRNKRFQSTHNLSITLTCNRPEHSLTIFFKPACHIKLDSPPKPNIINSTIVSSTPQVKTVFPRYTFQLQWRLEDESWSDYPEIKDSAWECMWELNADQLIRGGRYEARTRVMIIDPTFYKSTYSEWSPTVSWVSHEGRTKPPPPPPPSDPSGGLLGYAIGAAAIAMFLIVVGCRTNRTTWVYIVKKIKGPPIPNPEKFFPHNVDFQTWLSPYFTSESLHSFLKPLEIVSVEVTSAVDAVAPCGPQAALLEKMRREKSCSNSNFSNPSYSQLCPLPPVSSLAAGNLAPCATDTPYGPVGSQGEGKNPEVDRDEVKGKEVEICQLLSKGSDNSEHMLVISDYERAENPQVERIRLQSLDSGVCSGEEVSHESLEADSINGTDNHDERPEGEKEREGGDGKEVDVQKLLAGSGGVFDKSSILVCSGYERVPNLQADSPELFSMDSGMGSGGEEQVSQEEDAEKSTESTSLLCHPPSPSPCSLPSFTPPPFNSSGPGSSPGLQPLPSHLLERIALMSTNRSVEPSSDGYMPVRQEQKN
ncbi:uncharacterized protein LOC131971400 [Centropristis striata]|uniref:uncharacterized protein LOC131971400 n=1 Tax=Centropristis striata TaxID=184440 RepID=UPI0027E1C01C|nr:uncharacterized protein LOC131971400 [Centropristis striata]